MEVVIGIIITLHILWTPNEALATLKLLQWKRRRHEKRGDDASE